MPKYSCLGYPSRTEAAVALKAKGHDAHQIADMIGITVGNVHALLHYARTRALKTDPERSVYMRLTVRDIAALKPHAEARGLRPCELAARLIRALVEDNLIDAVLDDAEGLV